MTPADLTASPAPLPTRALRAARGLLLACAALVLAGCATTMPADAGRTTGDPLERINRHVFAFNDNVDQAVLKPVAQAYSKLPDGVRSCVGNFFANLGEVPTALNNLLQGKPGAALNDVCRFVINTTVGLAGCFDVARGMGLERNNEDFGQTLGRWGAGPGAYLVLPFLGPSSVRDAVGTGVGFYTDPLDYLNPPSHRYAGVGVRVVDVRAGLLQAENVVAGAALDRYRFIRDAYLQRRRNLVYDGEPPPLPLEEEDPEPVTPAAPASTPTPAAPAPAAPASQSTAVSPVAAGNPGPASSNQPAPNEAR